MSWHIDGIGGGGGRIAVEFWKNTNIGLKGSWIIVGPNPDDPKEEGIGDVERGNDPGYYIFTNLIADLKDTIKRVRGHEGIDIESYNKRIELSMSAFSIEEVRNKIAKGISTKVFKSDLVPEGGCESILFAFEFGGGLETKVLNIVSEELHKKTWAPIYALGALSYSGFEEEKGEDRVHFNTAWALRNLLVKKRNEGVDALFLVDKKAIEGNREEKNSKIFECLLPMINPRKLDDGFTGVGLREKLTGGISMPQIFVPCYYATKKEGEDVNTLLKKATENCLMGCDYTKADSVIVFTSLLSSEEKEKIKDWVNKNIINDKISEEKIHVCRVWNHKREILMLLRNSYGGENLFFERFSGLMDEAIKFARPKSSTMEVSEDILRGFNDSYRNTLTDLIDELILNLEETKGRIRDGKPLFMREGMKKEKESPKVDKIPFEKSKKEFESWLSSVSPEKIENILEVLKMSTHPLPTGTYKEKIYGLVMSYAKGELTTKELKGQLKKGERLIEEEI